MKQVDEDQWVAEELDRLKEEIIQTRTQIRALGFDPDELSAEIRSAEIEREREAARNRLNEALRVFKTAAHQLAAAYENELIDPLALSDTWPCWMPAIEDVAAEVEKIEPLEERPKVG